MDDHTSPTSPLIFNPEPPGWRCELFGLGAGLVWRPRPEDKLPNWFWRWMQFLAFGNAWIYTPKKDQ